MARHFLIERNSFHSLTPYGSKESALSISSWDYSFTILDPQDIAPHRGQTPLVLNSTAFDLLPSPELEATLMSQTAPVRLQISLGAELTRNQALVFRLLKEGCGLDFLIDRPISDASRTLLVDLCRQFNIRLCVLMNRFFSTQDILRSLPKETQDSVFLLILPPLNPDSHCCAADHVYRILSELEGTWRLLIFENAIAQMSSGVEKSFFSNFELETFLEQSKSLRSYHSFREVTVWLIQRRWIFFLDFLHSILLLIRNPSLAKFSQLLSILIRPFKKIGHSVYIFLRYRSFTQIYSFLRYESLNKIFYWVREKSAQAGLFCKYKLAIPFYYKARGLPPQIWIIIRYRIFQRLPHIWIIIRYRILQRLPHIWLFIRYQIIHRLFIFCRYTALGWLQALWGQAWRLKEALRILLFPILKIYWFFSYQFRTRIRPLFQNKVEDE